MKITKEVKLNIELTSEWEVTALTQALVIAMAEMDDKDTSEFFRKIKDGLKL